MLKFQENKHTPELRNVRDQFGENGTSAFTKQLGHFCLFRQTFSLLALCIICPCYGMVKESQVVPNVESIIDGNMNKEHCQKGQLSVVITRTRT